ncbi:winged helix-turn-helix domain-containing protein [Streptomyces sp. NPDC006134]|uniref:helix-turn-helix domain-containing protein n=1 Tax=Streptomyces sp. NPDC006134 TaxID=3154467 RepID=UPI0033D54575
MATLTGRTFHLSSSVSGATRLMHRLGFSLQVPARRVAERDEQAVTARKEENPQSPGPWNPAHPAASRDGPPSADRGHYGRTVAPFSNRNPLTNRG